MSSLKVAGEARSKLIQDTFEDDLIFITEQVIFADARVVFVLDESRASHHKVRDEFMLHF